MYFSVIDAVLSFEMGSYTINEDARMLELSVILIEGILERSVSANISALDLDAQSIEDYAVVESVLTFSAGANVGEEQKFIVRITDDQLVEFDEKFSVEIVSSDNAVHLATKSALIIITDNDCKYARDALLLNQ